MARNSDASMTVDVNFGKIDKQKMQELSKQITEGLRSVEIDPKWMKTQKDLLKLQKEHSTILDKQSAIADNITKTKGKHKLVVDQIKKLNIENKMLEVDTNKAIETRKATEDELIKIQQKIQELKENGTDSDEDALKIKKLEGVLNKKLTTDIENENKLKKRSNELEDKLSQLNKSKLKIKSDIKDLDKSALDVSQEEERSSDRLNELNTEMNDIIKQRKAMQEKLAEEMQKTHPELTEKERLKRAKQMLPLNEKQSKFEKKQFDLYKKTRKMKKEDLKDQLNEIKLHGLLLKQQGIGFFERKKILKEEKRQAVKSAGRGVAAGVVAGGGPGAGAAGYVGGELMTVAGKLAGPLMALGGIATAIMMLLNFNKEIKTAQKNILKLAASGSIGFGKLGDAIDKGAVGQANAFRESLRGLYNEVGMTYEDAVKNVEALTKAGFALDITQKTARHNFKEFMADIEQIGTITGQSFEEVASEAGDLRNEFKKTGQQITDTFVIMKNDAKEAGITTSRFYSNVMNAAQGLAIYGNDITQVSASFRDLTKGLKMPQKQAEQLATEMLNSVNTMTDTQKVLVMQLSTNGAIGKSASTLLNEFEKMDVGPRIEAQVKAMIKASGGLLSGTIDKFGKIIPDKLGEAIESHRFELNKLMPTIGISPGVLRLIEQFSKSGKKFEGIGTQIGAEQAKELRKKEKEQAHIIEMGTRAALTSIQEKIWQVIEQIYDWLTNTMGPLLASAAEAIENLTKFFGLEKKQKPVDIKTIEVNRSTMTGRELAASEGMAAAARPNTPVVKGAGYARGGYTGTGSDNDIAGAVHKNEYVFDKDATQKAGINNLNTLMSMLKGGGGVAKAVDTRPAITNHITLNINQRDRQEIEQIIYRVLYDEKTVGA